ncbi:MAG: hypothetical protein U9P38_01230 [Campylobacterota bacterium]|nr:hypothetical protein [Campylobacterota bacterium]
MKYILLALFLVINLSADKQMERCQTDLKDITSFYYQAIQMSYIKSYQQAIHFYKKSAKSSYLALEHCQEEKGFDFAPLYDYIISAELKIQEIEDEVYARKK